MGGKRTFLALRNAVFRYDAATFTIVDEERGLLVAQTCGPGHGVYAGLMTSPRSSWSLRFLVSRSSNQHDGRLSAEAFIDPSKLARLRNADYQVQLHITTYPPTGEWDRQECRCRNAARAGIPPGPLQRFPFQ